MARRTHAEFQGLVAAFALDAVEDDEITAVEEHLSNCPKCRAELQDFRDTAGFLSYAGSDAPHGLWERIAGQLEAEPPAEARIFPFVAPATGNAVKRWRTTAVAAAAVAAVLVAVNGALLVRQGQRTDDLEPVSISALAEKFAADPSSTVIALRSPDGAATADVVMRPNGTAYLLRAKLPPLAEDMTYQLWGITLGQAPVSLSVLGNDPKVVAFSAKKTMEQLAITVERAGGSAAPSNSPLLAGPVA